MQKKQPRIMAINSLSCFGKNALTIGLPILSAAGAEVVPLPTVLLSSQPGGLPGYSYHELTGEMRKARDQWLVLGLEFDVLYSGFLCSAEQADIAGDIFVRFARPGILKFVDPAMADNGRMYAALKPELAANMARLCAVADIICPNITEAAFMLGESFCAGPYERGYIEGLISRLAKAFPACTIVLTGVYFDGENIGAAVLERDSGRVEYLLEKRRGGSYHGTGDLFASSMLGAIINGFGTAGAADIAARLTGAAIARTVERATDPRHGLAFEEEIPLYLKMLGLV